MSSSSDEEAEEERVISVKRDKIEFDHSDDAYFPNPQYQHPLMENEINIDDPSLEIDTKAENQQFSERVSIAYKEQFSKDRSQIQLTNRQKFGLVSKKKY